MSSFQSQAHLSTQDPEAGSKSTRASQKSPVDPETAWKTLLCSTALDASNPDSTTWQAIPSGGLLHMRMTPRSSLGGDDSESKWTHRSSGRNTNAIRMARDTESLMPVVAFSGITDENGASTMVPRKSPFSLGRKDRGGPIVSRIATWKLTNQDKQTTASFGMKRRGGLNFAESIDEASETATLGTVSLSVQGGEADPVVKVTCSGSDTISKIKSGVDTGVSVKPKIEVMQAMHDCRSESERLLVLAATQSLLNSWRIDGGLRAELAASAVPTSKATIKGDSIMRELSSRVSPLGDTSRDVACAEDIAVYGKAIAWQT